MRVYVCQINTTVGDIQGNKNKIISGIGTAKHAGAEIVLFPELALTGYPPSDIILMPHFIDHVEEAAQEIATTTYGISAIVGLPRTNRFKVGKPLHNSAAVITDGRIIGYHDKILLPTYDVFDERRYFEPGTRPWLWDIAGAHVAITICEDIWAHSGLLTYDRYMCDPITDLLASPHRPAVHLNLSASPYSLAKSHMRMRIVQKVAKSLHCPTILCNLVGGNESLLFDGASLSVAYDGTLTYRAASFKEDEFLVDTKVPITYCVLHEQDVLKELFEGLVMGIRDYCNKSNIATVCLGLSGGIDSALVACIAAQALGKERVVGVSMPSRYSSPGSLADAEQLAANLGIHLIKIPIEWPFKAYLKLLSPIFNDLPEDITEENIQARIRGMILMALSNKFGHMVLSTGNKSELAMGYATLYGDMCGGLNPIGDLSKRRVYALGNWVNRHGEIIPKNSLTKPPSAELREGQLDSDTLPDYEYIDTIVEEYLEYKNPPEKIAVQYGFDIELVHRIIRQLHRMEYKRRQGAPLIRVTEKAFNAGCQLPIIQRWI